MKKETFVQRVSSGKVNNLAYFSNGKEGLISVWMHEGTYVLTWEECPPGEQYDEATYTRDERHVFAGIPEVLDFISSNGFDVELFTY